MKKALVIAWLILLAVAVGTIFWYTDLVYRLPTPVPAGYKPVAQGTVVNSPALNAWVKKPVFLHFFNPDCPCSKFNVTLFKALVHQYGQQLDFAVVVMSNKKYTAEQIREKIGVKAPILFNDALAKTCGVYSTPQVALLNNKHELFYRGNYNRTRYCADEKTNYAKMAIQGLLSAQAKLSLNRLAYKSYGCELPGCSN